MNVFLNSGKMGEIVENMGEMKYSREIAGKNVDRNQFPIRIWGQKTFFIFIFFFLFPLVQSPVVFSGAGTALFCTMFFSPQAKFLKKKTNVNIDGTGLKIRFLGPKWLFLVAYLPQKEFLDFHFHHATL